MAYQLPQANPFQQAQQAPAQPGANQAVGGAHQTSMTALSGPGSAPPRKKTARKEPEAPPNPLAGDTVLQDVLGRAQADAAQRQTLLQQQGGINSARNATVAGRMGSGFGASMLNANRQSQLHTQREMANQALADSQQQQNLMMEGWKRNNQVTDQQTQAAVNAMQTAINNGDMQMAQHYAAMLPDGHPMKYTAPKAEIGKAGTSYSNNPANVGNRNQPGGSTGGSNAARDRHMANTAGWSAADVRAYQELHNLDANYNPKGGDSTKTYGPNIQQAPTSFASVGTPGWNGETIGAQYGQMHFVTPLGRIDAVSFPSVQKILAHYGGDYFKQIGNRDYAWFAHRMANDPEYTKKVNDILKKAK